MQQKLRLRQMKMEDGILVSAEDYGEDTEWWETVL